MNQKSKFIITILSIVCLFLCVATCYFALSNPPEKCENPIDDKSNIVSEEDGENNIENDMPDNEEIDDETPEYGFNEIDKVVFTIPCSGCGDPESHVLTICRQEDIEYILYFMNKFEHVGKAPTETSLSINPYVIEVVDYNSQSISFAFRSDGVAWLDGDEYKLSDISLIEELENRFLK